MQSVFNYDEGDYIQDGKRKRLSQDESEVLLEAFNRNPRPNQDERNELAQRIGLNSRSIQIWFQNRRAKLKRESNDPDLFSFKHVKAAKMEENINLPSVTAGNFKELCLPKYLDIPIKGQQLTSEDMSKNDAIRKFWKRQQESEYSASASPISEIKRTKQLSKSMTPPLDPKKKKKIKLSPDDLGDSTSFNMPDLVPFKEILSSSGGKSSKFNCSNLAFLTKSVKQIRSQNTMKMDFYKPNLDTVTTDLGFLFDGNKNLTSLELLGTTKQRPPLVMDQTLSEIFSFLPDLNNNE